MKPAGLSVGPRPQTGAPGMGGGAGRTQQNFYNPAVQLSSKPQPLMNAFAAGSSADISAQNIDVNPTLLTKNQSRQFPMYDGPNGSSAGSYVPVSAMSGIAGIGPTAGATGSGPGGSGNVAAGSTEDIYGMSNRPTSSTITQAHQMGAASTDKSGPASAQSSAVKKSAFLLNEPSADDLSQNFDGDMADQRSQTIGGNAAKGAKTANKRESGSLENSNLQALSQPGQRPGTSG